MPPVVQLRCQLDLLAWDSCPGHHADFLFVPVAEGSTNMAIAMSKRPHHGMVDLLWLGLPCAEADNGYEMARVQQKGFAKRL